MALDNRPRKVVKTAADLDREIRDILALENVGRGDEISGTFHVYYTDESVKSASLIKLLEQQYGVQIEWHEI